MRSAQTEPNLLIIGAMRAGTTSAYRYLAGHPDIYMTPLKEPMHLAFRGGSRSYSGPGDSGLMRNAIRDEDAYFELFQPGRAHKYRGEASAIYLYIPEAIDALATLFPTARCLVILRDPVERAYSSFQYLRTRKMEVLDSFEEALQLEDERIANGHAPMWHYFHAGEYGDQLAHLFSKVHRDNVWVMTYDDLAANGPAALSPILEWLGLPPLPSSVDPTTHNRSGESRYPLVERLLTSSPTKRRIKDALPGPIRRTAEQTMRRLDRWRNLQIVPADVMNPETAHWLRERYADQIAKTEDLTGLNLSMWRRPGD